VNALARPAQVRTWRFATLMASLVMIGPFSIDMYLPAFAAIGAEYRVGTIAVQQTLSAYLFAYAFMMLWHGALSDALGRRPVVLASLAVYAVATLGCAIAGNIESMWLARALQGLSAGAGLVVGRALIRDRFHGAEAQRLMSQVTLVFALAPALAPIAGGLLLEAFGWRSIFWSLFVFTIVLAAWTIRELPETHPPESRTPLKPGVLARNYKAVVIHADFLLLAFVPALCFCAFFLYIAAAPMFLMTHLGVSTTGFGWLFVPLIAGVMIGATDSGRLAGRLPPLRTVGIGFAFMGAGALGQLAASLVAPPAVGWHVAPLFLFMVGSSMSQPSVSLLIIDLFPTMRGLASSLQGFVQFALGGIVAGTIAPLLQGSLVALAAGMIVFFALAFALWSAYLRRNRDKVAS